MPDSKLLPLPATRQARWEMIRAFAAEWNYPLDPGQGIPLTELALVEQRLEFALPAALREWYQMFGTRPASGSGQNYLLPPQHLGHDPEAPVLVFYIENQGNVSWGIRRSDLDLVDPPVLMCWSHEDTWIEESHSLSAFMFPVIILEVVLTASSVGGWSPITADVVMAVDQHFYRFDFPAWHWPDYPTRFFRDADSLLIVGGTPEIFILARTWDVLSRVERWLGTTFEQS